jgi:hypothetical protein
MRYEARYPPPFICPDWYLVPMPEYIKEPVNFLFAYTGCHDAEELARKPWTNKEELCEHFAVL